MKTNVRQAVVLFGLVLVVGAGCEDRPPEAGAPPVPRALSDSIEAGYERLHRMYTATDSLPPDVQQMRGTMEKMNEQMRHHRQGMGRGMHQRGGMHKRGMHDGQGMDGPRGMHGGQGEGMRRDSTRMWEWHQQMMSMHAQMARMHTDSGLAGRHRQMARRHRHMMNALPSEVEAGSSATQQRTPSGEVALAARGESLYGQHCASCHGPQGAGVGPFPPLVESDWVTGDEGTAIRILLHGVQGRIEVDGQTYDNVMPAFGRRLSDEEIASLLSYIRSSWGNEAPVIPSSEVREIRRTHAERADPWTAAQLQDESE